MAASIDIADVNSRLLALQVDVNADLVIAVEDEIDISKYLDANDIPAALHVMAGAIETLGGDPADYRTVDANDYSVVVVALETAYAAL